MKRITSLLVILSLLLLGGITMGLRTMNPPSDEELEAQIQGAWRMVLRNGSDMEELQLQMVKIVQDGYFMFAYYQEETQSFYSAGGGTYTVENGMYSEDIRFHTIDPNLVGEHVPFSMRVEDNHWYHEGVVSGEELKEVFERADTDGTLDLTGAWESIAYSESDGELYELRERDPQTWKLVTNEFFQWVTFDKRSGDLMACSGGTFQWKDGIYAERISFHQQDTVLTGHQLIWPSEVQGNKWVQTTPLTRGSSEPLRQIWVRME